MDDDDKQSTSRLGGDAPRRGAPRPTGSGEGMASVIEQLREHLRRRQPGMGDAHDPSPDGTRLPPG